MKLRRVVIKNFRKLSDIDFSISKNLSVVVGPNASGKSSIFEAIRLAKAILFPRVHDELRNVMVALGATSAHFAQGNFQYDISALAGDATKPISIALTIEFSDQEILSLQDAIPQVTKNLIAAQLGRQPNDPTLDLVAYMSTPIGQEAEKTAKGAVDEAIKILTSSKRVEVKVEIDATGINGSSAIYNMIIGHIEQRLTPEKTIFSYFPADRSLPVGEVVIQIGPQDFKAQLDSHFSAAATKYGRLKQTVVNRAVLSRINDIDLAPEFNSIFDTFLPGKEFVGLQQKPTGLVTVLVRDKISDKVFDIDSLSSGEKGLVLSFLLFKTSLVPGSISLVDELELHLNPAVCRKILPYLAERVAESMDCQFIVSTHSAEITRDAYDRDDAELFHLRNGSDISPILRQDVHEVVEAISLLGVSAEQALTAKALIFVEGDSDVDILQAAFPDALFGIELRPLKGRQEIEASILALQAAEKKGGLKERQSFLFDNDRKQTSLRSTELVKIEQLERYCLENYLVSDEVLYDLLRVHASNPPESRGALSKRIRELAIGQLDSVITAEILAEYRGLRVGLTAKEVKGKGVEEIASLQLQKLKEVESVLNSRTANSEWADEFKCRHAEKKLEREPIWENDWKKLCSGKVLMEDIQREYTLNMDLTKFKCIVASELARLQKDDITILKGIVVDYCRHSFIGRVIVDLMISKTVAAGRRLHSIGVWMLRNIMILRYRSIRLSRSCFEREERELSESHFWQPLTLRLGRA